MLLHYKQIFCMYCIIIIYFFQEYLEIFFILWYDYVRYIKRRFKILMENYYELLEVDVKASKEIIDKAFKVLAKRYHPDTQPEDKKAWAEEMFKKINEAYEVLSNPEAREKYDIELDYDKNSAIQALCAKNEHLQKLVEELENELKQVKSHTTNSYTNARKSIL